MSENLVIKKLERTHNSQAKVVSHASSRDSEVLRRGALRCS